jgi:hypothetical protein
VTYTCNWNGFFVYLLKFLLILLIESHDQFWPMLIWTVKYWRSIFYNKLVHVNYKWIKKYDKQIYVLKFRIFCPNFLKWPNYHWIYNNLCNQCLLPLKLWVRTHLWRGELNTTLCHKVCQWLATGQWFSPGTLVSSTNKTDRQDITEIFLKLALNIVTKIVQTLPPDLLICTF